jgi:cyclopropane-fatty-acyl-phospholipid synthase
MLDALRQVPFMDKSEVEKAKLIHILSSIGVSVDGLNPWDIRVHNSFFYRDVLRRGTLGLGEGYVRHWWDVVGRPEEGLPELASSGLRREIWQKLFSLPVLLTYIPQILNRAKWYPFQVGEEHYDVGNNLYRIMLDKRMTYTCGWWEGAGTLDDAQEAKLDLVCRKIGLKPGMRVLDVGCGWGSFARYAAEKYHANITGVTVSKEQTSYIDTFLNRCINVRLEDWRDIPEGKPYDRIVSLGMFEHVGKPNYPAFFQKMCRLLKEDGLFLLHTIGSIHYNRFAVTDPWIHAHIFPNSFLPSEDRIRDAIGNTFFVKDWHQWPSNFYEKTLIAWYRNFIAGWDTLTGSFGVSGRITYLPAPGHSDRAITFCGK